MAVDIGYTPSWGLDPTYIHRSDCANSDVYLSDKRPTLDVEIVLRKSRNNEDDYIDTEYIPAHEVEYMPDSDMWRIAIRKHINGLTVVPGEVRIIPKNRIIDIRIVEQL